MAPARMRVSIIAAAVSSMVAALAGRARAEGNDHTVAEGLITVLRQDAAHQKVVAQAVANASDALERAQRFHDVGDPAAAQAADGLAREWAETGRDLVRAVDAEMNAAAVRMRAFESQQRLERTRALVEEAIARVGRLGAELEKARGSASDPHAPRSRELAGKAVGKTVPTPARAPAKDDHDTRGVAPAHADPTGAP